MPKVDTAPLFEPPESEGVFIKASMGKRMLATLFDILIIFPFIFFPLYIAKGPISSPLILSILIYSFILIFSYFFFGYLLMGRTTGDAIAGIKLWPGNFSTSSALIYSFVKTLLTIIPFNLILILILEDNLTAEQYIFEQVYSL